MKYFLLAFLSVLFFSCAISKAKHWEKAKIGDKGSFVWRLHGGEMEDTNPGRRSNDYVQSKVKTSVVNYYQNVQPRFCNRLYCNSQLLQIQAFA